MVIGFYEEKTLQYEGRAHLLTEKSLPNELKQRLMTRGKPSHKPSKEDFMYFKITPGSIRLTDVSSDPWHLEELECLSS